jgi:hypothetical protein
LLDAVSESSRRSPGAKSEKVLELNSHEPGIPVNQEWGEIKGTGGELLEFAPNAGSE